MPWKLIGNLKGSQGVQGPQGEPGLKGEPGATGSRGEPGPQGPEGPPGKDGAPGVHGRDGIDGKDGAPGLNGKDGGPGEKGAPGPIGEKGLDGRDGKDGRDGESIEGPPGRDALELEILPMIDEQKRYPRGSYAKHDGGLWRAFKNTQGMDGWEVVVAGFPRVDFEQGENPRQLKALVRCTGGEIITHEFSIPVMMYRGVWKHDEEYARGDTATWDGSLWHCEVQKTTQKPGGASGEWKLAVKRGNHGKDGTPGDRGPQGPKGDPGKDMTYKGL